MRYSFRGYPVYNYELDNKGRLVIGASYDVASLTIGESAETMAEICV
jgi:hypothetical protein